MNFYNYYLILCNQNDESPSGAALKMKLSKTAVNNWKKGGLPSDITLQTIASHFNVPIEQFWKCEDIAEKRGFQCLDPVSENPENKKTATSNGDGNSAVAEMSSYAMSIFRQLNFENKILAANELRSLLQKQQAQDGLK